MICGKIVEMSLILSHAGMTCVIGGKVRGRVRHEIMDLGHKAPTSIASTSG